MTARRTARCVAKEYGQHPSVNHTRSAVRRQHDRCRNAHSRALSGILVGLGLNGLSARTTSDVRACRRSGRALKAARAARDEFRAMTVAMMCCAGCKDQVYE